MSFHRSVSKPVRVLELRSVRGTGGGPEKTIILGAAQSDPSEYAITVCYIRDRRDPDFGPAVKAEKYPIDYVEILERHSLDFRIWSRLRQLVRKGKIDIVHSHDYKTDFLALLLARVENIIPLATAHGWTGHTRREQIYYQVDKFVLGRFPCVIAVSSQISTDLILHGTHPDRIRIILNGIDAKAFKRDRNKEAEARAALHLPLDRTIVGAVGRLEPQKRFDLLIEAFAFLQRQNPNLYLAIAGDGTLRQELQGKSGQMGIQDSFRLLGRQDDIIRVHHALDLFVQSSKYEGTPNAVLEAMALGTPIVATDAGGTAEIMRNNIEGIIIPTNDLGALIRAIGLVLEDAKSAGDRTKAARSRIETDLSFERRMRKVEALYEELAAHCARGGFNAVRRNAVEEIR
jgi:glycosyltransferase involved in cell wall biosynthesis